MFNELNLVCHPASLSLKYLIQILNALKIFSYQEVPIIILYKDKIHTYRVVQSMSMILIFLNI